ncbi:ABC transporter ATP-binding protein [Ruminococcus flavefaciens]|uniref:Sugar ABC transporter ATP-binding protein n=1 Tax=Ruminococcus flavefaciens 007c TaxID=1341157 RepID=W7UYM8_RUMFL|nr:ABC transporter ATP-binding protein [Ruminococcus flavefaciens]EWM53755.1 sugar ABC transporter ATP-binding protein [Ruminococcus flavefaciens 007c]
MLETLKRVFVYARPYLRFFLMTLLFAALGVSMSLAVPVFIGEAVDCCVGKGSVDFEKLVKIIILLALTVIFSTFFQWLMSLCTNKLAFLTIRDLRADVFNKLERVPLKYIDGHTKGELTSRVINDIEIVSDGLLQGFTQFFSGIMTIIGTLIFMMMINYKIAIVVVILTPLSFIAASKITKASHDSYMKQSKLRGDMVAFAEEMAGNQKIVKAFGYDKRAEEKFDEINNAYGKIGVKATFFSSMTNPTTRFVNGLIYASVGLLGALGVIGYSTFIGTMTVGKLSSFLAYANQYTKPFNEISGVFAELQNAVSSAERVFSILDEEEIADDSDKEVLTSCDGTLSFSNVFFSYDPKVKLIRNFSLDVKSGQRIAIVGPTGCGKSTIINLLLRFYDIDSGKIELSGKSISDITRDSLRSCFGMVLQETWVFTGTVAENIAYGVPDADRERIIEAAKAAYAHSFIKRLPQGYDTVISEDCGLSQGQKQLICIARIMLMDPPMLILDEATSSIDLRTELRIQRAFLKLMEGRTSFVIAHRLSTIKNSDVILVMKQGNIIEQGNHAQLIEKGGFYAELYNSQFVS